MSKLFSYFNLKKEKRTNVEEPKNLSIWLIHGASEFLGTILITLGLAGLSTVANSSGDVVEHYLGHSVLVGFYAGFVVVGILLFIFLRYSCDLNPAVTLYRWLSGQNTSRYAIYKITIQMIACVLAGLMIYGMGNIHQANGVANHAITLHGVSKNMSSFKGIHNNISSGIIIFVAEIVMTMILLFSIFSKSINNKYRDLMIMFIISMDVWMGVLTGTAAINPARGLGQQIPGLFFGHTAGNAKDFADIGYATLAMLLGTFLAPAGYLLVQGLTEHYLNPFVIKVISYKNKRTDNMNKDPQNK
ncbi:MAG: aquaporin [Mycoplasmatales bacterium]|nr:aquaporin [Mycoplasmatales bacterium]